MNSEVQADAAITALGISAIQNQDHNDVYYKGVADLTVSPATKINMIYPANQTHIAKYRRQPVRYVVETPELYKKYVLPYIERMKGPRLQWVDNILYHGAEADRVVLRTDEFVLLPDLKWDLVSKASMYLIAIVMQNDIASLRDLKPKHLPLLNSIKTQVTETVKERYGVKKSQLLLYVHYQPSYYHLHVHVVHIDLADRMGKTSSVLLDQIINKLEHSGPEGYENDTLPYILREGHELWQKGFALEQ